MLGAWRTSMRIGVRPFLGRKLDEFAEEIAPWCKTLFLKRIDKASFVRQAQDTYFRHRSES